MAELTDEVAILSDLPAAWLGVALLELDWRRHGDGRYETERQFIVHLFGKRKNTPRARAAKAKSFMMMVLIVEAAWLLVRFCGCRRSAVTEVVDG